MTPSVIWDDMGHGMLRRLCALTLLAALSIGFLGPITAAAAMQMPMQMPQEMVVASSLTGHADNCPACPKQRDVPGSAAMAPGCELIFCSGLPAIIPTESVAPPVARESFPRITISNETGLTIRPDLGPPRPIHHS